MRLSEAIILGDSLRSRNPGVWLYQIDSKPVCGCALGGAYLATGKTLKDYRSDHREFVKILQDHYPWFTERVSEKITEMFHGVQRGDGTLEGIADYVRSVEPDCDCNRFNCDCAEQAETQPALESVAI